MITIDDKNPREAIWQFYFTWINLIIQGKDGQAFSMLDGMPPSGHVWTPESFKETFKAITSKAFSRSLLDVISLSDARDDFYSGSGLVKTKEGGYWAHIDLPLRDDFGGQVFIPFIFRKQGDSYSVVLDDEEKFLVC
jgi:hypothetical protein